MAMMPEAPSHSQAAAYDDENTLKKLTGVNEMATSITISVPNTSLIRFMLATDIDLPALVNGKAQMAQQILARKAVNVPLIIMR